MITPEESSRRFMAGVTARKAPRIYLPSSNEPAHVDKRLWYAVRDLVKLSIRPVPYPLTETYDIMKCSRAQGRRLLEHTVNSAYGKVHEMSSSRRGGRMKLLQVLKEGADAYRLSLPELEFHGDWLHNVGGVALKETGRRNGFIAKSEYTPAPFTNVRCDLLLDKPDCRRVFCQIGVSNAEREAESIMKLTDAVMTSDARVLLVCIDKAFVEKVKRSLKGLIDTQYSGRIHLTLLGDVLNCYYEKKNDSLWQKIIGRE